MLRKLLSVSLCAVALVLLMGAGVESQSAAASVEENVQSWNSSAKLEDLETEKEEPILVEAAVGVSPMKAIEQYDTAVRIDGAYAPLSIEKTQRNGTTYVALAPMAKAMDSGAQCSWDGKTCTVKTGRLTISATVGNTYMTANGRYFYVPEGITQSGNNVIVPLWTVTRAFDAKLSWDGATGTVLISRGSGAIRSGDSFYNQTDLFWLSRVIFAESGNQSLEGKIAVGNVVMNRVANPAYPNTIKGVIAQRNQFSTYQNGNLANRTPNSSSVIAAKLVLDGAEVASVKGATHFDSCTSSWASRNLTCLGKIGAHRFYG